MRGRTLIFFLMLFFVLSLLTACGGKGTGEKNENEVSGTSVEVQSGQKTAGEPKTKGGENIEEAKELGNPGGKSLTQQAQATDPGEKKQNARETIPDSGVVKENPANKTGNSEKPAQAVVVPINQDQITLWITRDFGRITVLNRKVPLEKEWSVFEVLQSSADITTSYGGSYIESINGLKSVTGGFGGKKQDWLYYVNGVFCDVGALDYYPCPGDVVWWDYHRWENMATFPSVIGCYPQPFLSGFRGQANPTVIMSSENHRDLAGKLKQSLEAQGVVAVNVKGLDPGLLEDRQNPVIILGEWSELSKVKWLEDLNKAYPKNGTCVHFTAGAVELLDYKRHVARTVSGDVGIVTATGTGSGDPNPLWLVVGTSPKGLGQVVSVLVNNPGKIKGMYGTAILEGKVIRLPLQ